MILKEGTVALEALAKIKKYKMIQKYDFNDILIEPAVISEIGSRKDINPFYEDGNLPLITAPMDTVVDMLNKDVFEELKINLCLPRGEEIFGGFTSYSLDEIYSYTKMKTLYPEGKYLIDVANGHMEKMVEAIKFVKKTFPNITLMVGNIANPETYAVLSEAGADYIRVGIGNGGGCSTTVHTGVGFPMASLIEECYTISCGLDNPAKIVADGGMQNYSDIIKALALGADYVMVGSLFNKGLESCGDNYLWGKIKVDQKIAKMAYNLKIPVYKKFRGMSTKEVQKKWGKETLTTSEGVIRYRKVGYTIPQWVENFEAYLRSSMSYSNAKNLEEFIGRPKIIKITDNAYNRFKK